MNIFIANEQKHFVDAFRIRAHVFLGEQKISPYIEIDEYDKHSPLFIAYKDKKPVGTGRIIIEGNIGKIGRVAVLKDYRNSGIGSQIILEMLDYLKQNSEVKEVRLGAQSKAIKFYENLGFKPYGGRFIEATIEHQSMKYQLRK